MRVFPAEWAPQEFVQLTWPHQNSDWSYMLPEVEACFVTLASAMAKFQNVVIICNDAKHVTRLLSSESNHSFKIYELPSDDTWARDHGGITIFENHQAIVCDFGFNGWGLKYKASNDNRLTKKMFDRGVFGAGYTYRNHLSFILEGGSIESDGCGTLLTTSTCLLSDNRNNATREVMEEKLKHFLGVDRILWLHHGYLAGDDTDSHIDTLARFCDEKTIAYVHCDDEHDEHFDALRSMKMELEAFRCIDGSPYRLIPLPMAHPVYFEGERLPATYANFLIINGAVLVPIYGSDKDTVAIHALKTAFPDREVIGIPCNALIKQHGSLHCVTMQYPAVN